jgi:hypothetical protein
MKRKSFSGTDLRQADGDSFKPNKYNNFYYLCVVKQLVKKQCLLHDI